MRILIAIAPAMYRETLAYALRNHRSNDEVRFADLQALDREAALFRPHLIVCNNNASEVWEISVPSWVVFRYQDSLNASVFLALGLEFFVGATILNLILRPTWAAVAITALTIAVRKLITLSLGRLAR